MTDPATGADASIDLKCACQCADQNDGCVANCKKCYDENTKKADICNCVCSGMEGAERMACFASCRLWQEKKKAPKK